MANQLQANLESALVANETFWNNLISKSSPNDQDDLVVAASNIRAKMLSSISCAKSLFETNMQCISMILTLKKQKSDMETQCEAQLRVNQ